MQAYPPKEAAVCAICEEDAREILYSSKHSNVIWGAGTYGTASKMGHVMVCPRRHVTSFADLEQQEAIDLVRVCALAARAAYSSWYTAGSWPLDHTGVKSSYNLGYNHGAHGQDSIPGEKGLGHLHLHVIPRNVNDTNFMWWTTQGFILHLKDGKMRPQMEQELRRLAHTQANVAQSKHPEATQTESIPNQTPAPAAGHVLQLETPSQGGAPTHSSTPTPTPAASAAADHPFCPDFDATEPAESVCPLCRETGDLLSTPLVRVLFSVKPYKVGHVMVIPRRHVSNIELFTEEEMVEVFRHVDIAAELACKAVGTDSYSVGINVGPHSGASIPSHCHIHIVPRTPLDGSVAYWPRAEAAMGTLFEPPQVRQVFEEYAKVNGSRI